MSATPQPDALTRIIRLLGLALLALFLLWFAYKVRLVLLLLVASILVAYALEPLVRIFSGGQPKRRGLGTALAFATVFVGLALVGVVTIGPAVGQGAALGTALAGYAQHFHPESVTSLSNRVKAGLAPNLSAVFDNVEAQLVKWLSQAGGDIAQMGVAWASSVPTLLAYVALILSMTGLILGSKAYFKRQVFDVIPTAWQADAETLFGQIDHALAAYVRGTLIIAAGVGVLLTIGMLLLGVHYALPIGLFAAVMQLVPVVGGALGLIGAVTVAAFQSVPVAIEVLLLFSVMFFVSGNILGPKVMGRAVAINPLVILVVTFAGTLLGGFVGLLLAVPVTAILRVIIAFFYQRYAAAWRLGPAEPPA